jgi:hypothetical protein
MASLCTVMCSKSRYKQIARNRVGEENCYFAHCPVIVVMETRQTLTCVINCIVCDANHHGITR